MRRLAFVSREVSVIDESADQVQQRLLLGSIVALCVPKTLNPDVAVMKSAKNGVRFDGSGPLNRARDRCILVQ